MTTFSEFPTYWKGSDGLTFILFKNEDQCLVVRKYPFSGFKVEESRTPSMIENMEDECIESNEEDFNNALLAAASRFETYYLPELV